MWVLSVAPFRARFDRECHRFQNATVSSTSPTTGREGKCNEPPRDYSQVELAGWEYTVDAMSCNSLVQSGASST